MNPETLPPPETYSAAETLRDDTTDIVPYDEDIDYETLRVFFGAGF